MTDTTDEPEALGSGATVVDLDHIRVLAHAASQTPEVGQRTPQATVTRWSRAGLTDLTIGEVQTILKAGEQGQTAQLADFWLRMLKTDAHLASVWHTRIAPVASSRWELTPGEGPESTAEAAKKLRDACEEALRGLGNLEPIFSRLLSGLGPGYAVAETVWGRRRLLNVPGWSPAVLKPVHPRRFQFSDDFEIGLHDESQAVSRIKERGYPVTEITGRGGVMARLPAGKYIVHQPPTIDDYPTATGLVHPVARWWWAKQRVIVYWLGGAEISANPRLIGKVLQKAHKDAAQDLLDGLESLASDGVILLREGTDVEIVPGQGESSARVWESLAKLMDAAMSKLVLGSTLNVEIGESGGNRAAAESQDNATIRPRMEQDGANLWSTLTEQLFRYIRDYNPHLFAHDTPLPVGGFVFAEDPIEVDQALIDARGVTLDELRASRGLSEWGGERGARIAQPGDDINRFAPAPTPAPTPAPGAPAAPEGLDVPQAADVQDAALNGAQVTSLLAIVGQVAQGLLPRQTAVEIIVSAFPIDRAQADRILGDVGRSFTPTPKGEQPAAVEAPAPVPEVAASADPFSLARAMGRAHLGQAVTQTSFA